jgi:hypothetical protein
MIEVEAGAVVAACDTMLNNPIAKLTGEEYGIFPVELGMGRSAEPISGIALTPLRIMGDRPPLLPVAHQDHARPEERFAEIGLAE